MSVTALLLAGGIVAAGGAVRWVVRKAAPPKRPVGDALVTTVEWFADGEVGRLRGIARPRGEPLIAPLSGRPCVGYELEIHETESGGADDESTRTRLVHEVRWLPFVLDDGTGRAVIDPNETPVTLLLGSVATSSGLLDDASAEERAALARHGLDPEHAGFNRALSYEERAIGVHELISVRGRGVREADDDPARARLGRGVPPTRLRMVGTARDRLAISTIPADLND